MIVGKLVIDSYLLAQYLVLFIQKLAILHDYDVIIDYVITYTEIDTSCWLGIPQRCDYYVCP